MANFSDLFAGGAVTQIATQTFTASGTWTKPTGALPTDLVVIDLWGGGGGGAVRASTSDRSGGGPGGGGGHNRIVFRASELSATEAVTVGSGGAGGISTGSDAIGSTGGYSEFKGHRAYGGGGGHSDTNGGTGGGTKSSGLLGSGNQRGGFPLDLLATTSALAWSTSSSFWGPGDWGGGHNNSSYSMSLGWPGPFHGGGGAVLGANAADRGSVWGGGAGGAYNGSTAGSELGGPSSFGGAGGTMGVPATNTSNQAGTNGAIRGGGGSGGKRASGTVAAGNGGRGEVVITVLRGV